MLGETIPGNVKGEIVAITAGMAMGLSVQAAKGLAHMLNLPDETLEMLLCGWYYAFGVDGMDEKKVEEAANATAQLTAILLFNKGVPKE